MRALAERQVEAEHCALALVAPGFLERDDDGQLQVLGNLPHVVAKVAGHLLDDHGSVRFAAERQQRLADALAERLLGPCVRAGVGGSGGALNNGAGPGSAGRTYDDGNNSFFEAAGGGGGGAAGKLRVNITVGGNCIIPHEHVWQSPRLTNNHPLNCYY